ncbi:MAG: hypothetical protein RDU24_00060 [Humidesulfovibrio sp.]|uniref:hypothetical protein n=1 Tax=Humidesulfovibrio sp. TaxID=2910988 RepID=UPI0027FCB6AC|nr:hypothetical protein [Humidesulfovibrio sp.]MDQ7833755.1 hypothetical protein [Humidesulfovibrio sp.]
MPFHFKFDNPPVGYSLEDAAKEDATIKIISREFVSSEDGDIFISRLDGFPSEVLRKLPQNIDLKRSNVDHLLAIIDKDGNCSAYVNELQIIALTKVRRSLEKGETIFENDIYDILQVKFEDVEIPNDCGIAFVFSKGWRKGYFYDFTPLVPGNKPRSIDLHTLLGSYYNYLIFQDFFKICDDDWAKFYMEGWFPFISLDHDTALNLIKHIKYNWNTDELIQSITGEVKNKANLLLNNWILNPVFAEHEEFLKTAIDRYLNNDYISCLTILYTRAEGILRAIVKNLNEKDYKQDNLANAARKAFDDNRSFSKILPHRFSEYLQKVLFSSFDHNKIINLSRNSVSHGVAPNHLYNAKSATIAILTIEQIYQHLQSYS